MKSNKNKTSGLNHLFVGTVCVVVIGLLSLSFLGNADFLDLILGPEDSRQEVVSKPESPSSKEIQTSQITESGQHANLLPTVNLPQPPAVKKQVALETRQERPQIEPPLTDIAPEPPVVDVRADEHPTERIRRMNFGVPPQYTKEVKLPRNMNLQRPPRWNKTLASPAVPKEAPDPFTPPPIKVDPRRRPQEEVERLTIGE